MTAEAIKLAIPILALGSAIWMLVGALKMAKQTKKENVAHRKNMDEFWAKSIVTKAGWYNPNVTRPHIGQECKIDCGDYGERTAIFRDQRHMFLTWRLTDCTHPMQNMNMYEGHVKGWKPVNPNDVVTVDAEYQEVKQSLLN